MSGHILKDIDLELGSTSTTVGFHLTAENRMATTLSLTAATTPVLQHSLDGTTWSNVSGITLATGVTGWNLHTSTTKAPLPLVRITSSSVAEVTRFTFSQTGTFYDVVGAAKAIQLLTSAGVGHYFWFTVSDGAGLETDPALTGTGHEIVVAAADASSVVATAFHTAVNLVAGVFVSTNGVASQAVVTHSVAGDADDATATGTAAAILVTTDGVTAVISDVKVALVK